MKAAPKMAVSSSEDAALADQVAKTTISKFGFADLLESGKYSDIALKTTHGKTFALHRSIVCPQSKPLAAIIDGNSQETAKVIDLIDDESQSVEYMIEYLYNSDYDHAKKVDEGDNSFTESALSVHTNVYDLAGKYEITNLKAVAHQKYIDALSVEGLTTAFTDHLRTVLNEAPGGDRKLRDSALEFVGERYRELAKNTEFVNLFREDANFAVEVFQTVASIPLVLLTKPCPKGTNGCGQGDKFVRLRSQNDMDTWAQGTYYCENCGSKFD